MKPGRHYPHVVLSITLLGLLTGCATIKFGGERTPRYDREGNEVVYISTINTSRLSSALISKDAVVNGAAVGANAGAGLAAVGAGAGMLSGGLIAGAVKSIKERGKLEVNVVDFDVGTEVKKSRGWDQILREPWTGWDSLRPKTWARIKKDDDGYFLVACNPACPAVEDATGVITPLPPEKHMWVFNHGPAAEFRVTKNIPAANAEKIAQKWPAEVGKELMRLVRERDAAANAQVAVKDDNNSAK